jgi:hypothetical protein
MSFDFDMRIDVGKSIACRVYFPTADVLRPMNYLPLQIRRVNHIKIDNTQPANARGGKIHPRWRAESAGADHQYARGFQFSLTLHANFRHDQMATVTSNLLIRERRQLG